MDLAIVVLILIGLAEVWFGISLSLVFNAF